MKKRPPHEESAERSAEREASSFGARLRGLRQAVGMTQEELADRAGLSPNAVSALERGQRKRPYPHTVRALADALGLDEDERAALLAAVPARSGDASSATAPAAAEVTPASSSMSSAIPRPATPLVGRERELEEVAGLLGQEGDTRLLTLTGIGGVGKTRLAVAAAREVADHFPDGVVFAGLAPLGDPALVLPTIVRALGLREGDGQTPGEVLRAYLREKELLLVLDNFEHLLEAAPEVAGLIEACPGLAVLATSRAPLRIRGEHEYPVSPLALPPSTRSSTKDDILGSPSGRLFLERARAVSPGFEITKENAGAVAAICWRLAGLPLGLELAAAKVRLLDPATLLSRLDKALSTAWARDLPERQRTMRAALDWSHDLLSAAQQELLRRLSVFAGGFSLEAAEAVGAADSDAAEEVLELLGGLIEQSLVEAKPDPGGDGVRYRMLEPVSQYALERLEEKGEAEEARQRHAAFFTALAERTAPKLLGFDQIDWLYRLEREIGNLRAAISWSLDAGEFDTVARAANALHAFWWIRGYHAEGRRWAEAALAGPLSMAPRLGALQAAAALSFAEGDYGSAEERWQEELSLSGRAGDAAAEGYALAGIGTVAMARSDHEAAVTHLEAAIAAFERGGIPVYPVLARLWLGTALLGQGDYARAKRLFEEGLAQSRRLGNPATIVVALYNLAQLALAGNDHDSADRTLREGVKLSVKLRDRANLAHFLEALAAVAAFRGEAERSAVMVGAAEGSLREVGAPVYNFYAPDPSLKERAVVEARAALGHAAFEEAREHGRAITFDQAVEYALGTDEAPATTAP